MTLSDEIAKKHIEKVAAETERWCWKAIAEGVGNRVWRSDPIVDPWPSTTIHYRYAILKPGEGAPGSGTIYGPFSKK